METMMTIIIIINVTTPARIFSLFDPRIDLDGLAVPLYPYGFESGVPLKGFFIKLSLYDKLESRGNLSVWS